MKYLMIVILLFSSLSFAQEIKVEKGKQYTKEEVEQIRKQDKARQKRKERRMDTLKCLP